VKRSHCGIIWYTIP